MPKVLLVFYPRSLKITKKKVSIIVYTCCTNFWRIFSFIFDYLIPCKALISLPNYLGNHIKTLNDKNKLGTKIIRLLKWTLVIFNYIRYCYITTSSHIHAVRWEKQRSQPITTGLFRVGYSLLCPLALVKGRLYGCLFCTNLLQSPF